ncbi:MAG: hypothetical protein K2X87_24440 [Gemmataceae bacterium]|nr:hypothetical protein [Gemmataceae bacterium]
MRALFPQDRHPRFVFRRHSLKLSAWSDGSPLVGDLDWRWSPGLEAERLAELLVPEPLGPYAGGLRLVFFAPDRAAARRTVWGLYALPLSPLPLSRTAVEIARLRRAVVAERFFS